MKTFKEYIIESISASEKEDNGYLVIDKDGKGHLPTKKNGKIDHRLMGSAWAALTVGYRGKKYQGPDKTKAIAKLKALYKKEKMETPNKK